jgi:hypothetical protein
MLHHIDLQASFHLLLRYTNTTLPPFPLLGIPFSPLDPILNLSLLRLGIPLRLQSLIPRNRPYHSLPQSLQPFSRGYGRINDFIGFGLFICSGSFHRFFITGGLETLIADSPTDRA